MAGFSDIGASTFYTDKKDGARTSLQIKNDVASTFSEGKLGIL